MPKYKNSFNGHEIVLTADSPEQAATAARLYFAGRGRANEVADQRLEEGKQYEASPGFQPPPQERSGNLFSDAAIAGTEYPSAANLPDAKRNLAIGAGILATGGTAGAAIAHPLATATGIAGSYGGEQALGYVGRKLEGIGAPEGTGKALGAVGGLGGGIYGAVKGRPVLDALRKAGIGRGGMLGQVIEALAPAEAGAAAGAARTVTSEADRKIAQEMAKRKLDLYERNVAVREAAEARRASATVKATSPRAAAAVEKTVAEGGSSNSGVTANVVEAAPVKTATRSTIPKETPKAAPVAELSADDATLVLKIQQQGGLKNPQVQEFLASQPPEVAARLEAALTRRQAHQATVLGKLFDAGKAGPKGKPGLELARLLGQAE